MFFAEIGCQQNSMSCGAYLPVSVLQCLTTRVKSEPQGAFRSVSLAPHFTPLPKGQLLEDLITATTRALMHIGFKSQRSRATLADLCDPKQPQTAPRRASCH
jgi:hypothetical protein